MSELNSQNILLVGQVHADLTNLHLQILGLGYKVCRAVSGKIIEYPRNSKGNEIVPDLALYFVEPEGGDIKPECDAFNDVLKRFGVPVICVSGSGKLLRKLQADFGDKIECISMPFKIDDVLMLIGNYFQNNLSDTQTAIVDLQQRNLLQPILDSAPLVISIKDIEGRYLYVNHQYEKLFNQKSSDILGRTDREIFNNDSAELRYYEDKCVIEKGVVIQSEEVISTEQGHVVYFLHKFPLRNINHEIYGICGMHAEITEYQQARHELKKGEQQFKNLTKNIPGAIYRCSNDADWSMHFMSDFFEEICGYPAEEFIQNRCRTYNSIIYPEDIERVDSIVQNGVEKGIPYEAEYRIVHANGAIRWVLEKGQSIASGSGSDEVWLDGVIFDITERKQYELDLKHLATYDSLTNLPNRTLFMDLLKKAISSGTRNSEMHAVMFLDLDNFKGINDTLGHEVGDQLLISVADRLRHCVRESDTIARLGGDEFTLIMYGINSPDNAAMMAEKIIRILQEPYRYNGQDINTNVSIGIVIFPENGKDCEVLLRNADVAMYNVKNRGRGNYSFFTEEMNRKARSSLTLESKLRKAIVEKKLLPYYQPKIDIENNCIMGLEALARWPVEEGFLSPGEFIPVAEKTRLIIDIDQMILEKTLVTAKRWLDIGSNFRSVAVNLSSYQFQQDNLIKMIDKLLKKTGFPAALLELEITEHTVMTDAERSIEIMNQLRNRKIKLSIDDFGTGYSSLSYLKRFPVETLKIDMSFIKDMTSSSSDQSIVASIIDLSHNLGLEVVAEGVETEEQFAILKQMGCHVAQGYLFSPPVSASDFEKKFVRGVCQEKVEESDLLVT